MKKKVTYIISDISKIIAVEWVCEHMDQKDIEFSFIFLNNGETEIEHFVKEKGYAFIRIEYAGKKDLLKAIVKAYSFLKKNKTTVIHCHLFVANLVGLIAGWLANVKKRIYTRHHSTYHHDYFPKSVKYDKLCNFLATDIIAISDNVQKVLSQTEHVSASKIVLIHHGFLIREYADVSNERLEVFKSKYLIKKEDLVIGVVSRYTKWKGIQYVVPAFSSFLNSYPNAKLLIANAHGNDEQFLRQLFETLPEGRIIEVKYERDMAALYHSLNMYVHTPINEHCEAFGQTYVEALIAKVPSIFTLSGIAREFIVDKKNALVVDFENDQAIAEALLLLANDPDLSAKMKTQGYQDVVDQFALPVMIDKLKNLYLS